MYAGLPLAFALTAAGKQVYLANLSFANLDLLAAADRLGDGVAAIRPDSVGLGDYFPNAPWPVGSTVAGCPRRCTRSPGPGTSRCAPPTER
ncbi:hypothetical protein [Dactylosporangium sp. NPDC000521]|uniref:hypothetical protein n=1 Tax=Dactylosporangium sp. NPDC000521 TaxID=3363975 RepID=UPI0036A42407